MTTQTFDHSVAVLRTLLWAHNQAVNLPALLQAKFDWYDANHRVFWDSWRTDVFDLRTATSFGLSVWSVILDLPLFGEDSVSPASYPAIGFETSAVSSVIENFERGNFATDAQGAFSIPLEQKRLLLRLRYFQLVTRGAVPEINRFLRGLFGPNEIYALDNLDMTMTYTIVGPTARAIRPLLQLFDVLPRPAAVSITFVDTTVDSFGFGDFNLNFNNGSFVE